MKKFTLVAGSYKFGSYSTYKACVQLAQRLEWLMKIDSGSWEIVEEVDWNEDTSIKDFYPTLV